MITSEKDASGRQEEKPGAVGDGAGSCSTNEAAQLLGVALQTVQRWVDRGHLRGWRTPGGHRRVEIASVHEWLAIARQSEVRTVGGAGSGVRGADALPHVYLVDDSAADLELLQAVTKFVLPEARSTCLANGFAALMAIGREPPDMLITDIAMPGFNGIEMIRSLRENAATAHVPIIGLSNHHVEEIERLFGAIPEGVVMLRKPVAPDALRVAIGRVRHGLAA